MSAFQSFGLGQKKAPQPRAAAFADSDEELPAAAPSKPNIEHAVELKAQGDAAAAAGRWGDALRRWDEALAAAPAHDPHLIHESKAQAFLEAGDTWRAIQSAGRAALLAPDWPDAHLTLARAQLGLGEPELALASMERALALSPEHAEALAEVGAVRQLVLRRAAAGGGGQAGRLRVVDGGGGGS